MYGKTILLDLHVQKDLFAPDGALWQERNEGAVFNIYRLFQWASAAGIPIISAALIARAGHHGPFSLEPHCVEDSGGEQKLPRTLLDDRINLGLAHTTDLPRDVIQSFQQVIFETRDQDIFHHQKFERLITELGEPYTFVLCGGTVATGLKQAVLGLRRLGHTVMVAENAVIDLGQEQTEMAWLQIMAKGAQLLPTARIIHEYASQRPRRRARKAAAG